MYTYVWAEITSVTDENIVPSNGYRNVERSEKIATKRPFS